MKDHLLSIFPINGMLGYARVSCIALEEVSLDCHKPLVLSRERLVLLLEECFEQVEAKTLLQRIEEGHDVQLPVTTEQARQFGFVPKVN